MKYHLVTLGCQMNMSDSERVQTVFEAAGFEPTDSEEDANIIGILACSVRQKAIDKVYGKISRWNKWKQKKNLLTFVSGCILDADEERFLKLFDLVFRMGDLPDLPDMIRQSGVSTPLSSAPILEDEERDDKRTDFWKVVPNYGSELEAFVPIQNGCDKFCSFCAVPYTRGREVSRSSEAIIDEVKALVERDVKSITLLGQNVNSYGLDRSGEECSFAELLGKIGELGNGLDKEFWVYFTSPHPKDMTTDILDIMAQYPCLAKQIHLPLQSGDEKVLLKMNRNHTVAKYMETVDAIREKLPTATLFTDIIVGFTSETDEQFEETAKLMRQIKYNMAYIAKYSPRPGARSARWEDDIPNDEKKRRHAVLNQILCDGSYELNKDMVGKTYRVLIDGEDKRQEGALTGRTEGKLIVRILGAPSELIGTFQDVKITQAARMSLTGEIA